MDGTSEITSHPTRAMQPSIDAGGTFTGNYALSPRTASA